MDRLDLADALTYIHPEELEYSDWVAVGMALKEEGCDLSLWERWSQNDHRFKHGECMRKWETFRGTSLPVTGAFITELAKENGWKPHFENSNSSNDDFALDWDSTIGGVADFEGEIVSAPGDEWDGVNDLITYLQTLFDPNENVGYVTETWEMEGGKHAPTKGNWDRTAGQLIEELRRCKGDIGAVIGDYRKDVGAWIRFNPLDGKGVKNENVVDFKYALVESDTMDIEIQRAKLKEMELPIAALVHSGGKSLHAIVKVEAGDYQEYQKRVAYLYETCKKYGMMIDRQNKNPSRLSRLPGVWRNGNKQYLEAVNIGKESWSDWVDYIEGINDDLPDIESMERYLGNRPKLSPELIDGVLRQGHKMLIAGASKAGKSFLLLELCIAIAEGRKWLGWQCARGKVLYVNLELDDSSCINRVLDVYEALGIEPKNIGSIDIWNLRGRSNPMDKLAPKLIRRAQKANYIAVIIDPIYKVITGDENSADQMANFCNQFDKICTELGCATIYCHHHSKGSQGGKRSMDRASGSGVFARDPDALLDLIELKIPRDKELPERFKQSTVTAWRIEGTLREFAPFEPRNCWFSYPVHVEDDGWLADAKPDDGDAFPPGRKLTQEERDEKFITTFSSHFSDIDKNDTGVVDAGMLASELNCKRDTIVKWFSDDENRSKPFLKEHYEYFGGEVRRKR